MEQHGIRAYIAVPLFRQQGDYFGTLCALDPKATALDFDQLQLLEHMASLVALQMEADEVQRDRELLVGMLGHDLRNPLNLLSLQNSIALRDPNISRQTTEALQGSTAAIQRMSQLTSELLDFSRCRLTGGFDLSKEPVDLSELVHAVLTDALTPSEADRVSIICSGDPTASCDRSRVHQAVQNLVANACENSPKQSPVTVTIDGSAPDAVVVQLHNAGPAIPSELQRTLFLPFHRSGPARDDSSRRSTGLGLYIVSEIIRVHQGTLSFTSTDTAGTTFSLLLPRQSSSR